MQPPGGPSFASKGGVFDLSVDLRVPLTRIADIVHRRRGITPDTALRLARYFRNTPVFWMNLQVR